MTRKTLLAPMVILVALGCARSPAHPCQSVVECGVGWSCIQGTCQPSSPVDAGSDRTTEGPDAPTDAGCGDACVPQVCPAGTANCDTTSPDCEARIADAPACFPAYVGSIVVGAGAFWVSAIAAGDDGAIYLGGGFQGSADFDPGPGSDIRNAVGTPDGFVTKLNPDGSRAWTFTFGATASINAMVVSATSLSLAGTYSGTVDFDPGAGVAAHSASGGFVLQLALDGAFSWVATLDSGSENMPHAIARDANGDLYVVGQFDATCDFDPGPGVQQRVSPPSFPQPYLVKLSGQGALVWVHTYGGDTCSGVFNGVAVTIDGSAWVTGQISGTCDLDGDFSHPVSGSGALVAAFDPSGSSTSTWTLGHGSFANAQAAVGGVDGSIYVGGTFSEAVDFDPGPGVVMGSPDTAFRPSPRSDNTSAAFVVKLASDGALRAVQTMAGVDVVGLSVRANGDLLMLGDAHIGGSASGLFMSAFHADLTPGWSLYAGGIACGGSALATGPATFVVAGLNSGGSADLDPGPAVDTIPAGTPFISGVAFLSRYAF